MIYQIPKEVFGGKIIYTRVCVYHEMLTFSDQQIFYFSLKCKKLLHSARALLIVYGMVCLVTVARGKEFKGTQGKLLVFYIVYLPACCGISFTQF